MKRPGHARKASGNWFRGTPSGLFRSLLALILLCAQVLAAAHAVGHIGELSALARSGGAVVASTDEQGGLPAALHHERCLLCLAAADLASALPATPAVLPVDVPVSLLPSDAAFAPLFARLPRPHSRGPPSSPV